MNILIIGNGFDLAHNLPTTYKNFLRFTKTFDECKDIITHFDYDNNYGTEDDLRYQFLKYFQKMYHQKRELFDELYELVKDNRWLDHFYHVEIEQNWIDFESEISRVIQTLDAVRIRLEESLGIGEKQIRLYDYQTETLSRFWGTWYALEKPDKIYQLKKDLLSDLNKLTRCLEIYLSDYVGNLAIETVLTDIAAIPFDKVLSFNYTNTYAKVYNATGAKNIEYDYIHGKADVAHNVNTCNLVLGIDEYLGLATRDDDNEFIQFKKFFQRIFKGTGDKYSTWLEKAKPMVGGEDVNLYIYGHSLDVTDKDIFRKLLLHERATATIFHHSQDALGSQIANLVKVIGQDELIQRTDGANRKIRFVKTGS